MTAAERARQFNGDLILRNEDLDPDRCRAEFVSAMYEDLRWLGISWSEGPDCEGEYAPYSQSERREFYLAAWKKLRDARAIYPCTCSRKDLAASASAPNDLDDEPIYPGNCRGRGDALSFENPAGVNWRFRVPDGEDITLRTSISGHSGMFQVATLEISWFGGETMFRLTSWRWLWTMTR